jgi:hypothetical protein
MYTHSHLEAITRTLKAQLLASAMAKHPATMRLNLPCAVKDGRKAERILLETTHGSQQLA